MLEQISANENFKMIGLKKINIIFGRVASGKSSILREIAKNNKECCLYIAPEREGFLNLSMSANSGDSSFEKIQNDFHFDSSVRQNISKNFKMNSTKILFDMLDYFKNKGEDDFNKFTDFLERKLNFLLPDCVFTINKELNYKNSINSLENFIKITRKNIQNNNTNLSSGETELFSLATIIIAFRLKKEMGTLLLDEPDLHLHPDSQYRLMKFILELFNNNNYIIIIATHSTSMLNALADENNKENLSICFLDKNLTRKEIIFNRITQKLEEIVPIFGAHPLTQVFNKKPILLVEGVDDEWIWTLLVKSKAANVYPCQTGSVDCRWV